MKRLQGKDWERMKYQLIPVRHEISSAGNIKGIYKDSNNKAYYHWFNDEEKSAYTEVQRSSITSRIYVGSRVEVTTRSGSIVQGVVMKVYPEQGRYYIKIFKTIKSTSHDTFGRFSKQWLRYNCKKGEGLFVDLSLGDKIRLLNSKELIQTCRYTTMPHEHCIVYRDASSVRSTNKVSAARDVSIFMTEPTLGLPGYVMSIIKKGESDVFAACIFYRGDTNPRDLIPHATHLASIRELQHNLPVGIREL